MTQTQRAWTIEVLRTLIDDISLGCDYEAEYAGPLWESKPSKRKRQLNITWHKPDDTNNTNEVPNDP